MKKPFRICSMICLMTVISAFCCFSFQSYHSTLAYITYMSPVCINEFEYSTSPEQPEPSENSDTPEPSEQHEPSENSDTPEPSEQPEPSENSDTPEPSEQPEPSEISAIPELPQQSEISDVSNHSAGGTESPYEPYQPETSGNAASDTSNPDTGDNDIIWLVLLNAAACLIIYYFYSKEKSRR